MKQIQREFEELARHLVNGDRDPALDQATKIRFTLKNTIKQQDEEYVQDVLNRYLNLIKQASSEIRQSEDGCLEDVIDIFDGKNCIQVLQLQQFLEQHQKVDTGVQYLDTDDFEEVEGEEGVEVSMESAVEEGDVVPRPLFEMMKGKMEKYREELERAEDTIDYLEEELRENRQETGEV